MKKILLIFAFTTLLLTGCGDPPKSIISEAEESSEIDSKFDRYKLDKCYSILVEKESGICYLEYEYRCGYQGYYGITVMLNPDGTPKIWRSEK